MNTGERYASKGARTVRERADGKGPEPRTPRRRPTSLGGGPLEKGLHQQAPRHAAYPAPGLLAAAHHALSGPGADFAQYTEHARGHGRTEERIVRTAPVTTQVPIDFPHAAQVFRVIRYVGGLDGQRRSKEVAYCVTSLNPSTATATDLAQLLRDHWGAIENKLHWVRDTTFNEDASTLRAGTAPQAMAIIPVD